METQHSTERDTAPRRMGRPATWGRLAVAAALAAAGLLVVPAAEAAPLAPPARSAPAAPQLPADPQVDLAELEKRATRLSKQYHGELVKLNEAKNAAKKAASRQKKLDKQLEKARKKVAELAASQYMSPGPDPALTPLLSDDPDSVLDQAVTAQHLAQSTNERVTELSALMEQQEKARRLAREQLDEVRKEVDKLEKRQNKVQGLIAQFGYQVPMGDENITPRMEQVRALVAEMYGAPYGIGCYRPGGSGEHPLGRACDFMLSSGGAMPSGYQQERGWDIANWAKDNADRLGIMYIIYRQQIWDIRSGGGWEAMEDRGSVTANHYDHVHVSVF
ncbi:MAG: hypothetical protein GEV03_13610 [Streptosporangiales bacterium]|nr:hypothetical protein [Streptosporangiales bacterium]